jgi:hypothetical protein
VLAFTATGVANGRVSEQRTPTAYRLRLSIVSELDIGTMGQRALAL